MSTRDLEYISEEFDRDDDRRAQYDGPKWRPRKRPEYCKKTTPVRLGIKGRRLNRVLS